jgi:hypothetical protein
LPELEGLSAKSTQFKGTADADDQLTPWLLIDKYFYLLFFVILLLKRIRGAHYHANDR